jgi:hypothetical protein
VAQSKGLEFKTQYCKLKEKKDERDYFIIRGYKSMPFDAALVINEK